MAKIKCEYDTETKKISLMIDGEEKQKARRVSFYSEGDEYGYFEASFESEKDNGVYYNLSAHGSEMKTEEVSKTLEKYFFEKLIKK